MTLRRSKVIIFISSFAGLGRVQAEPLEPIANWVVDYRDDQCLASRDYGAAGKAVTLAIRPAPDGKTYELLVARPRSGPDQATEMKGSVDFGHGTITAWVLNYALKTTGLSVFQYRISAAEMDQASSATTVSFRPEGALNLTFALRSMPALMKGLQDCTTDLKRYWNMEGEKDGRIEKSAKGEVRAVFKADDYPGEAIERGQQGSSRFLLLIDEKGSVAGCHVVQPSGVPLLDAMGCQVIRARAKFEPARDKNGKAVRSTLWTPSVVWRLEN